MHGRTCLGLRGAHRSESPTRVPGSRARRRSSSGSSTVCGSGRHSRPPGIRRRIAAARRAAQARSSVRSAALNAMRSDAEAAISVAEQRFLVAHRLVRSGCARFVSSQLPMRFVFLSLRVDVIGHGRDGGDRRRDRGLRVDGRCQHRHRLGWRDVAFIGKDCGCDSWRGCRGQTHGRRGDLTARALSPAHPRRPALTDAAPQASASIPRTSTA